MRVLQECLNEEYGERDFQAEIFFQTKTTDADNNEDWEGFKRYPDDVDDTDSEEEDEADTEIGESMADREGMTDKFDGMSVTFNYYNSEVFDEL